MFPKKFPRNLLVAAFLTAACPLPAAAPSPQVTVFKAPGDYVVFLHGFSVFNQSVTRLAERCTLQLGGEGDYNRWGA